MSPSDATSPLPDRSRTGARRRARRRVAVPAAVAVAALAGQMAGGTYTVQKGDTLWSLSRQHGTTIDAIVAANGIADPNLIIIDQQLSIPGADETVAPAGSGGTDQNNGVANAGGNQNNGVADKPTPGADENAGNHNDGSANKPASAADQNNGGNKKPNGGNNQNDGDRPQRAGGSHTVAAGETLWSIAQANNTTVAVLQDVNDIGENAVAIGQVLELPGNGPAPTPEPASPPTAAAPAPATPSPATGTTPAVVSIYRVQPGDTGTSIAARFGISVESLLQVNQLSSTDGIVVGEYVRIPSTR